MAETSPSPTPVTTEPTPVDTPVTVDDTPAPPPEDDPEPVEPAGAEALWGSEFSGTAEVTVDVYDYCNTDGSRRFVESETYSMDATLSLSSPRSGGGATEDNPFSMLLAVGQPAESGALSFWSAAVSTGSSQDLAGNPRDPDLLLTYWQMEWDDGELTAQLTDPHTEEAVALNLLNWPSPLVPCRDDLGELPGGYPHALGEGTTLGGDLDTDGASLTAEGATGDGQLEFRFDFSGGTS
ncbi:hypothetical protein ACIQAC_14955 [Streptomyces sp. NPDC088387]|uniref:hypothetical protein n=1 Tax=Streptomyces sp. NPDC088387 TaxID=3365859 RepID=UPI00381E496C